MAELTLEAQATKIATRTQIAAAIPIQYKGTKHETMLKQLLDNVEASGMDLSKYDLVLVVGEDHIDFTAVVR